MACVFFEDSTKRITKKILGVTFDDPPKSCYVTSSRREGAPGWGGRCTSGVFTPARATQGVQATLLHPAKA
ncbi:hypothetical protein CEXT_40991 [Caerostris extrusa]|uniref:Uncharacterized protein n=1 Tax=Caerostris extrusa TaxID=172846 RepID=A0AAV4QCY3_CAEEX|nr:hypothetical protein CEXT_40991 [Caerostris extrusa]